MVLRTVRLAILVGSTTLAVLAAPAFAQDAGSSPRDPSARTAAVPPVAAALDGIARDLGVSLLAPAEEPTVRVPLKAGDWTLLGRMQPYAALSARTIKPDLLEASGVTAPARESRIDDPSNGVGIGGGLSWRLSDRLDLFGEYLFVPRPRSSSSSASSTRRDADPPELKGGVTVKF